MEGADGIGVHVRQKREDFGYAGFALGCGLGPFCGGSWWDLRFRPTGGLAALGGCLFHPDDYAILLELHAEIPLIDERRTTKVARGKGFRVVGTLTILGMPARHDLLDLTDAFGRLKGTNFHYRQEIIDQFLNENIGKGQSV